MIYQEDWFMRQIGMFAQAIAAMLFGKKTTRYIPSDGESFAKVNDLFRRMNSEIAKEKWREAETLLKNEMNADDLRYLELALDFYSRLNELEDEQLEALGYAREELEKSLKRIAQIYGLEDISELT